MKILRKALYITVTLLLSGIVVILIYLASQKPHYNGSLKLPGLNKQVEVIYDFYGVPHIYAENEQDAYFALGYVHAQDRLFQMEMTRRVASGRLSEVLGPDFIRVDAFFKTLGLEEHALLSSNQYMKGDSLPYQKSARAYLAGLNRFIKDGSTPVEFVLLGIDKKEFTIKDLYLSTEYMAFNFAMAFRTDPLMSYIQRKLGAVYARDIVTAYVPGTASIPVSPDSSEIPDTLTAPLPAGKTVLNTVNTVLEKIPVPPLTGSNGWVLAPFKSQSGKVMLGNDTHIGFGQPATWYEAHMEYPGYSFYGNFLAGLPFAAIGHTRERAWGLTMLENDDLDFYSIRLKPGDSTMYWTDGKWKPLKRTRKTISVKGGEEVSITVMESRHGPLVQKVMPEWAQVTENPVAMWWTHLHFYNNLLQVTYQLNHASSIEDFREGVSKLISPGLNVMYGDKEGNIAWWAAGRLMKRAPGVNPVLLIDGSKYNLDPPGYYDFADNPHSVNPSQGFIYSANNQPDSSGAMGFYPGYYVPEDRAIRIMQLFNEKNVFTLEDMHRINLDVRSPVTPQVAGAILSAIRSEVKQKSPAHMSASKLLLLWDGDHRLRDQAPTIYYKLLYHILQMAMEDELGTENFKVFLSTHVMKNTILPFIQNDSSVWWNNINSRDVVESRNMIFERAYDKTITELNAQLGSNTDSWEWGRVHILEHKHPIGMKKPFNIVFNVGPYPVPGGPEVINQMGFDLSGEGVYRVKYGPAMRIVLDLADVENSKSILPTGQSGNVMSRYYYDQAIMYNTGKMRKQKMNRAEIESNRSGRLVLEPQ